MIKDFRSLGVELLAQVLLFSKMLPEVFYFLTEMSDYVYFMGKDGVEAI